MLLSPICLVLPMERLILIKVLAHINGLYGIFMHAELSMRAFLMWTALNDIGVKNKFLKLTNYADHQMQLQARFVPGRPLRWLLSQLDCKGRIRFVFSSFSPFFLTFLFWCWCICICPYCGLQRVMLRVVSALTHLLMILYFQAIHPHITWGSCASLPASPPYPALYLVNHLTKSPRVPTNCIMGWLIRKLKALQNVHYMFWTRASIWKVKSMFLNSYI